MSSEDENFLHHIRKNLDDSCDRLDGETLSRLNQARQTAIETKSARLRWLVPATGFAAAASVAVLTINLWSTQTVLTSQIDFVEDMELLSSSEDFEFYENLEFYQWLEDEEPLT